MQDQKQGIEACKAIVAFTWRFFSFGPLFRTLLNPIRRDTVSLKAESTMTIGERVIWNLLSRVVGLIARLFLIFFGFFFLVLSVLLCPLFLIFRIPVSQHWLRRRGAIGRDLAYGYTAYVRRLSRDMAHVAEESLVGKEEALSQMERVLARTTQNNVLLVGEPGVGRTTLIEQFAKKADWGETLEPLQYRHVFELLTEDLTPEELRKLFTEAALAGNVIVVLDNLHSNKAMLDELLPFTQANELQIIGITDYNGYHTVLKHRRDIMQRFEKVELGEPEPEEVVALLKAIVAEEEVEVTDETLHEIVRLTSQLIHRVPQPEKSVDLIEELLVGKKKEDVISLEEVHQLLTQKTNVPVGELSDNERDVLLNLEALLKQEIVGQDQAVEDVVKTLQRARAGVTTSDKPIGSFLFLGPTGVGKTYTAKMLSRIYYQSDNAMVRFDMSEYSKADSVDRFLSELVIAVENNPFTLMLFDEVEKSNPAILNLFLQLLDEGFITNTAGEKGYFSNTFIICTSNAGSNLLADDPNITEDKLIEYAIEQNIFKSEFLNRFDGVVAFRPLGEGVADSVAGQMMQDFAAQVLRDKKIAVTYDQEVVTGLADIAAHSRFGARAIKHTLDDTVASYLAQEILQKDLGPGSSVHIPLFALNI